MSVGHVERALKQIEAADAVVNLAPADPVALAGYEVAKAQVHATLALVEQQRIANEARGVGAGEVEFAQGLIDEDDRVYVVGKSFGSDAGRVLDEGYVLVRRVVGPWEVAS